MRENKIEVFRFFHQNDVFCRQCDFFLIKCIFKTLQSVLCNAAIRFSEILVLYVMDCSRWGEYRKSTKVRLAVNEVLREGFNY